MSEPTLSQVIATSLANIWEAISELTEKTTARISWELTEDLKTLGNTIDGGGAFDDSGSYFRYDLPIEARNILLTPTAGVTEVGSGVFPRLAVERISDDATLAWASYDGRSVLITGTDDPILTLDADAPHEDPSVLVTHCILNFSSGSVYLAPPTGETLKLVNSESVIVETEDAVLLGFGVSFVARTGENEWSVS